MHGQQPFQDIIDIKAHLIIKQLTGYHIFHIKQLLELLPRVDHLKVPFPHRSLHNYI